MKRPELQTGVVYAWHHIQSTTYDRGQGKCVFVDLNTIRTATRPRYNVEDQRIAIAQSPSYVKHWGDPPASFYGASRSNYTRRGYLAVTGPAETDDTDLIAQAEKLRVEIASPDAEFHTPKDSPVGVVAPREVRSTWTRYVADREQDEESRKAEAECRRKTIQHVDAARNRIRAALGEMPPHPKSREDEITVSLQWLADLVERAAGHDHTP
jgi:hypothetical protein